MTTTTAPAPAVLPPFYARPLLLRAPEHAGLGLRLAGDLAFAAAAPAIPLVTGEFALAARHYPIVFSSDDDAMPLAVTGVAGGRNLFVEDGRWRPGTYVPGYVRRYPFIAIAGADGGPVMLAVDEACPRVVPAGEDGVEPFFTPDGQPTELSRNAIALCEAYAIEHERTRAFARALLDNNLLVERQVQIRYNNQPADSAPGARIPDAQVRGFRLVDEAAFRALSADVLAAFHASQWLDLIVLHLASQAGWQTLVDASAQAAGKAASQGPDAA